MQDFTKPLVVAENLPKVQAKWLNKDRLWNFVFWFGMSFGLAVAHFTRINLEIPIITKLTYIFTLIGIPVFISLVNKTSFIKKDTFANGEGKILTKKQMPYSFALAGLSGIGVAVIVAETFFKKGDSSFITSLVVSISLFSGISLYFIFKNCPISILFNRKFWTFEFKAGGVLNRTDNYNSSSRRYHDRLYNPSHRHHSQNIYHSGSYDYQRYSPSHSNLANNIYHNR